MRVYTPFISEFCTGLVSLTLYKEDGGSYGRDYTRPWLPTSMVEALTPLIKRSIGSIKCLKKLEIAQPDGPYEELQFLVEWFNAKVKRREHK